MAAHTHSSPARGGGPPAGWWRGTLDVALGSSLALRGLCPSTSFAGPPPRAGEEWRSQAGFSLIEMLVSLAVMGMAAWLLTAGIARIAGGLAVAQGGDDRVAGVARAQFLLRQRLAAIAPVSDPQAAGTALDFSGQAETIDFIGPVADRAAPDAGQHYRLQRGPDGDVELLQLSTLDARIDPRARQSAGWARLTLVPATTRIAIRYLGQNPLLAEQHAVWQANWSHRAALPMAIRISIAFADGDRRSWPELVVHPRAATPEPCPRDALTGGCAAPGDGAT